MKLKNIYLALILAFTSILYTEDLMASEKSVKHLELADVTSHEEAKQVFSETTTQLSEKNKLDSTELNEIHIITYSLEKAVAYFAENMHGEQQVAAQKIAAKVELVHIASENNLASETKTQLEEYFKLADAFSAAL